MNKYIDIHTHHFQEGAEHLQIEVLTKFLTEPKDHLYCYGLHPWYIKNQKQEKLETEILKHSSNNNFFALGETGLDKACSVNFEKQLDYFSLQVELAIKHRIKIIVLHCVKSFQEIYQVLKEQNYQGKILIHDFQGNAQTFEQFNRDFECYISLNLRGLSKSNAHTNLKNIPLENTFFETDSDEQQNITAVYQNYCELFRKDIDTVCTQVWENFQRLKES